MVHHSAVLREQVWIIYRNINSQLYNLNDPFCWFNPLTDILSFPGSNMNIYIFFGFNLTFSRFHCRDEHWLMTTVTQKWQDSERQRPKQSLSLGGAQTESRFIKCMSHRAMRWKVYGHTQKHRWVLSFDTKPFLRKSKLSHHDTTKCALCQGKWSASMFTGCVWASKRTAYTVEQLEHYKKTQQAIITTAPSLCQALIPLPSLPVMIPVCPAAHVVRLKWQTHVGEIAWCHRDTEWRDLGATRHSQAFKFFPSLFPFIWFLEQRQRHLGQAAFTECHSSSFDHKTVFGREHASNN